MIICSLALLLYNLTLQNGLFAGLLLYALLRLCWTGTYFHTIPLTIYLFKLLLIPSDKTPIFFKNVEKCRYFRYTKYVRFMEVYE